MQMELLPLIWNKVKDEFWCRGLNHTYTIFDSNEGIGVRWHDLHNDSNDKRYGFTGVKDAMEWVEYTHHPAQIKPWVRFIKGFKNEPTKEVSDSVSAEP